jgi:hypothetical protein
MEWVDGTSLDRRLEAVGLTAGEAVSVVARIASALGALHRDGLVHRDVKPSNVMLVEGDLERVKLIDFGIARRVVEKHRLTFTGAVVGTPGYMSPEQARGARVVDARADVFSLGCVLYECVAGWAPFFGEHSIAVRTKIVFGKPLPIHDLAPEVPRELVALLERMLAKSPEDRPRDADEVAAALAAIPPIVVGPVRRTIDDEPRTVALRSPMIPDLVILIGHPGVTSGMTPEVFDQIDAAVRAIDPAIEAALIDDSAVVLRVSAGADLATRGALAARCARASHAIRTDAPIAIAAVAPSQQRGASDGVDRVVEQMLSTMLMSDTATLSLDDTARALLGNLAL